MPSSAMAAMAFGLTFPEGREPEEKLEALPKCLAKPSAIWERLLFSMQTKRMFIAFYYEQGSPGGEPCDVHSPETWLTLAEQLPVQS